TATHARQGSALPAGRGRPGHRPARHAGAALRIRQGAGHRRAHRRAAPQGRGRRVTGILLVDKPEGMSSAGVIRALKPCLAGSKVGHLGTLDPFASGLLPLCLGEATKVARYLLHESKAYTGTIRLGVATDTLDRTGTCIEQAALPPLDQPAVAAVAARFTGRLQQVPPMYSALKREGVPLYKLARRGVEVERAPRQIEIARLDLRLRDAERIDFTVACSKGTYVRVLAADVGAALGTVAHLEDLRRTQVGSFRIEDAHT